MDERATEAARPALEAAPAVQDVPVVAYLLEHNHASRRVVDKRSCGPSAPEHLGHDRGVDVAAARHDDDGLPGEVEFAAGPGSLTAVIGPSGAGKSTLSKIVAGGANPSTGTVTFEGRSVHAEYEALRTRIGYMTQKFSLFEDLSVRENLEFVARLYAVPDATQAARDMIARLGLQGREEQLAGSLSGGWKQRLALGACTLPNPKLLLLDEPTAGVDPKARREFWNEIHALAAQGLTVLVSTHYMDEAERCHEIAYIAYGTLLTHGTVEQVVAESGLLTYTVSGGDLPKLSTALSGKPGVDSVAPFGTSLHVSGRDPEKLEAAIAPYRDDAELHWTKSEPSLEDVFIDLMGRAKDNFQ